MTFIFYLCAPAKICCLSLEAIGKTWEVPFESRLFKFHLLIQYTPVIFVNWIELHIDSTFACLIELLKINSPL